MKSKLALHTRIFIGLAAGAALGIGSRIIFGDADGLRWAATAIANPIGQVFLRLVFMAVIPLVVAALALGVAEIGDVSRVGRIGLRTLLCTLVLSSIAVVIGIVAVNVVRPGAGLSEESRASLTKLLGTASGQAQIENARQAPSITDTLLGLIPRNPFVAAHDAFEGGLLALMVFSLILGLAMTAVGAERADPLKRLLESVFAVMLKIIDFAMVIAPLGVAALTFSVTVTVGFEALRMLLVYVLVVVAALCVQLFGVYSIALAAIARRSPLAFFRTIKDVLLTAFATSSSNATLPFALKAATDELKIPREIGNFVLTIGATANQNGTALYEGVTVLFLAQFFGVELTLAQQVTVVALSIVAGIGTAGVPGGSLPFVVIILQSIGVPAEGICIILGVDRVLDMSRTVVNVGGDLVIAACIARMEGKGTPEES